MKLSIKLILIVMGFVTFNSDGICAGLLQRVRESAIQLGASVLETTVKSHLPDLSKKDFSNTNTENLGDVNYCACCIVKNGDPDVHIPYDGLEQALKKPVHVRHSGAISVFVSGKPKNGYTPIEEAITKGFDRYYSTVFGHPLTKLFPSSEFHIRKSDSEQKMLYALEGKVFEHTKTRDPIDARSELAYQGKTLVVYTLRNTCPFCNVALCGFLANQIKEYVSGKESLGIKNIHVFYSFDGADFDKSVRAEKERLKESMLLAQPNITYSQLSPADTIQLMTNTICSSYGGDRKYAALLKQIYATAGSSAEGTQLSGEFSRQFIANLSAPQEAEMDLNKSSLFCEHLLESFISNVKAEELTVKTSEQDLVLLKKIPESPSRNRIIKDYEMLIKAIQLEASSNNVEIQRLASEINFDDVRPIFVTAIRKKINGAIQKLQQMGSSEELITLLTTLLAK